MDFKVKVDEINRQTSKEQKKRIHYHSLYNFIYYFNDLKKDNEKVQMLLEEYVNLIESKNYSFTKEESVTYHKSFIAPIGMVYSRYLNFSGISGIYLNFLFFGLPNILLWFIFHSIKASLIVGSLSLVFLLSRQITFFKHKMFGYRY